MIAALKEKFGHLGLTYSIGGQISFDVFPTGQLPSLLQLTTTDKSGWDKTFSLNHIQDEGFEEIHFFGDKVSFNCAFRAWADEIRLTWVETITRSLRIRGLLDIPLLVQRIPPSCSTSYSSPRHRRVSLDSGSSSMHRCYLSRKRHPDCMQGQTAFSMFF